MACFATTFAAAATSEGVQLRQLTVTVQNWMDLRRQMGLADENIIEKVKLFVAAHGVSRDELKKLVTLSGERCPGYSVLHGRYHLKLSWDPKKSINS